MAGIHDEDGLRLSSIGRIDEHTDLAAVLHDALDGSGIRTDDSQQPPRGDIVSVSDVDEFQVHCSLLDVLDLLADLLNLGLEVDDHLCDVRVLALGADGVRLAVELLNEEVRLAADRRAGLQHLAQLRDVAAQAPGAFSLNEEGNLVVSVSGNTLPVTDANGNPVKAEIVDTNGNAATNGNARISIDRNLASSTYQLFGLPKYDANGMNVHYDVVESWTSDSGDYQSTKTVGDYLVEEGARHFHDTQTISFDNTRSGTRDIVFYKTWHDNYVSETLNQRPDIYLTLYCAVLDEDGSLSEPEAVPGYIHFSWSALAESTDAANEQMVTISGLSKYDSNGAEYIYYASESMSADGESLGYGDVQFDYNSIETADADEGTDTQAAQEADKAVKVDSGAESDDPTVDGTGWAIREDGTFVNRLDSDLTVQGTKLWENVPGNVDQGDLPKVTIYLQQKLAGDENAWGPMVAHKNGDT